MNKKNKSKTSDDKKSSKTYSSNNDIYLKNILQIGILDEALRKVFKNRKVDKNANND